MPRPSDGRIWDETAEYIRQECKQSWVGLAKVGVYAEAPEYARNAMVAEAKKDDDITHIFMLDADVAPPPDTILRLLRHNRDIVAGVYPLFVNGKKNWSFSLYQPTDENGDIMTTAEIGSQYKLGQLLYPYWKLSRKPFKAMSFGGSTVLIKKNVFNRFGPLWYKTVWSGRKKLMGHDFYFANRAREAGFELWVDPTVICRHQNTVELNAVFNAEGA